MSDDKNEEELNQVRRLAVSLSNEIDYKNQRLLEMEHKYNETTATLRQLVVGLTKEIDSKQKSLLEMEQKYSESSTYVKLLVNEIDKLHAGILFFWNMSLEKLTVLFLIYCCHVMYMSKFMTLNVCKIGLSKLVGIYKTMILGFSLNSFLMAWQFLHQLDYF